jgi:hypothetical protein
MNSSSMEDLGPIVPALDKAKSLTVITVSVRYSPFSLFASFYPFSVNMLTFRLVLQYLSSTFFLPSALRSQLNDSNCSLPS